LHDRIGPPLGHLADTEDATNEDGEVCQAKASNEELEALVVQELDGGGLETCAVSAGPDEIVRNQDAEDDEGKDLPDDTGHHEIVAGLLHSGSALGGGGNTSSGSLEDEGEQIAEDKDPRVIFSSDAGEVIANLQDDVLEREVDSGGEEGRCDDYAADLNVEAGTVPWVGVEHNATNVAWECVSQLAVRKNRQSYREPLLGNRRTKRSDTSMSCT